VRALLRWGSLLGSGAALYALGAARLHHRHFLLFLAILLALALLMVVAFLITKEGE
jgi:uncharacterized ion transporter superfamily protein YfcC